MNTNIILVISAFSCSLICNYLLNKWFLKTSKLDEINSRSSHSVKATKSGGIALFTSLFFITLILYSLDKELYDFSIMLPLGIIFIIGVYDDFYNADFKLKFFIQIIVAKLFIDQGFVIENFHGFLGLNVVPFIIAQMVTVFVYIIIVNAFNFIDGVDGLATSLGVFALVCFIILPEVNGTLFYINCCVISGLLPLYYFNFRKNDKVFLGDAGSLFLGSLLAINTFSFLNIPLSESFNFNPTLISMVILFYPLIDLLRVFFIRIRNKKSPFIADTNHLHHYLLGYLSSHTKTTLLIIFLNASLLFLILFIEKSFVTLFSSIIFGLVCFTIFNIKPKK